MWVCTSLVCVEEEEKGKGIGMSIAGANLYYLPYPLGKFPYFVVNTDLSHFYQSINLCDFFSHSGLHARDKALEILGCS